MARTQTLVQLTDDLVERLDREASRTGESRSALIREAVRALLDERTVDAAERRLVDGYRQHPQAVEHEWGDLEAQAVLASVAAARRLDVEEAERGLEW